MSIICRNVLSCSRPASNRLDEERFDSSELAFLTNIYCRKNSGAKTRTIILCSISCKIIFACVFYKKKMNKFNIKEAQKTLFGDSKNLSERGLNCDLPIMTIILVLLLDTLDYPTKSQAKNLSSSTIKLVRQLCQASSGERITV